MEDIRYNTLFVAMNQSDEMKENYDNYLESHISNVKKGFNWLYKNLPELFDGYDSDYIGSIIANHDASKYDTIEYFPYCEYFYGDNKNSEETLINFDYAWLHHQHCNPHHWQHWLLREDEGNIKALEMPYEYVLEMIADWWAFSWKENNLFEIFNWYENNTEKHQFHPDTKAKVEEILNKLKQKLEETNGNKE